LNRLVLSLEDLPVNYANPGIDDLLSTIELPTAKVSVSCRRAVFGDEEFLSNATDLLKNLYRFVKSVTKDSKEITDRTTIEQFMKRLPQMDVQKLVDYAYDTSYGLDTNMKYNCAKCKTQNSTVVGINSNFFTAS
jgi:hypothetical protein